MKKQKTPTPVLLPPPKPTIWHSRLPALVSATALALMFIGSGSLAMIYVTNELAYEGASVATRERMDTIEPFPIGVDPKNEAIAENPAADTYLEHPASRSLALSNAGWWLPRAVATLTKSNWYQNLASPTGRILIIEPGEREEQVANHFARLLGWSEEEKHQFSRFIASSSPEMVEGKYYPGTYVLARDTSASVAAGVIRERFETEVLARYSESVAKVVPIETSLTIASLLEREAYDFEDMRLISGVIWNRLFAGMKLQLDATMQYARGTEEEWWPVPKPEDKDIDSPYNTYQVAGLPPAPIASPSISAIVAALNPRKTECMYYFHDAKGGFHCAPTYEEHVALLKQFYGRGE